MATPTIVLVHGAFADAGSWTPVVRELLDRGRTVRVPAGYNRSLNGDAAYIRSFVEQIDGPVVLAGHSYGGAVASIAGLAHNVTGLVFVSAFVPDEGETLSVLGARFPDPPLIPNLVQGQYPTPDGTAVDLTVNIEKFPSLFAVGVDPRVAEVLAVSQRPLAAGVFEEPASGAAWKSKPSWGIVSKDDNTINPDVERFGYERAGSTVTELDAPHLVMLTHPTELADILERAADA
jgi:pimeloyl-ACP methyl ester carboxylesterase